MQIVYLGDDLTVRSRAEGEGKRKAIKGTLVRGSLVEKGPEEPLRHR